MMMNDLRKLREEVDNYRGKGYKYVTVEVSQDGTIKLPHKLSRMMDLRQGDTVALKISEDGTNVQLHGEFLRTIRSEPEPEFKSEQEYWYEVLKARRNLRRLKKARWEKISKRRIQPERIANMFKRFRVKPIRGLLFWSEPRKNRIGGCDALGMLILNTVGHHECIRGVRLRKAQKKYPELESYYFLAGLIHGWDNVPLSEEISKEDEDYSKAYDIGRKAYLMATGAIEYDDMRWIKDLLGSVYENLPKSEKDKLRGEVDYEFDKDEDQGWLS